MCQTVTRATGLTLHLRQRSVDGRVVALLALGSVPGTLVASAVVASHHPRLGTDRLVLTAMGAALVLTAVTIVIDPVLRRLQPRGRRSSTGSPSRGSRVVTVAGGTVIGLSVGLTSIGAGSLIMALLVLAHPHLTARRLVGTDLAHGMVLVSLSALLAAHAGHVDVGLVARLLIGSVPGVMVGSRASTVLPERPLRLTVAGMLLVTGVRLLPVGI